MSRRKQGFPLLLEERHTEFDDAWECSKGTCFTSVLCVLHLHLVYLRCSFLQVGFVGDSRAGIQI